MKTNTFQTRSRTFLYRGSILSLIVALTLTAFSSVSIFVGSASAQENEPNELELAWDAKLRQLAVEVDYFNNSFQTKPALLDTEKEQSKHDQYLERYRLTLVAAQSLVITQGGFDLNGQQIHEGRARLALQQLGNYLILIRGLKAKMIPVELIVD